MFTKAVRLLDHQRRLQRAEEQVRDLRVRLREQPEQEDIRHTLRIASRESVRARQALMGILVESSEFTAPVEGDTHRAESDEAA